MAGKWLLVVGGSPHWCPPPQGPILGAECLWAVEAGFSKKLWSVRGSCAVFRDSVSEITHHHVHNIRLVTEVNPIPCENVEATRQEHSYQEARIFFRGRDIVRSATLIALSSKLLVTEGTWRSLGWTRQIRRKGFENMRWLDQTSYLLLAFSSYDYSNWLGKKDGKREKLSWKHQNSFHFCSKNIWRVIGGLVLFMKWASRWEQTRAVPRGGVIDSTPWRSQQEFKHWELFN